MLKKILNINGTKELNKKQQTQVIGGNSCDTYNGPGCYGPIAGCASCARWQALPAHHKNCAFVHIDCAS
ncbi:hypothetical protein IMCC3317_17280 [Kordia antarctica]|uniref:Uncharacterized protein n=1 Tax=Kordia antarctica TaxID=1218801 RepID=A0A7L4ZJI7_9FLAO|nr:hypothetical protein [Kordia antarctica]QHI36366.1 hypothetical protein IMCC3317_17280 [Kordia antarctica]